MATAPPNNAPQRLGLYRANLGRRIRILGQKPAGLSDVYYWLISKSWFVMVGGLVALYVLANVLFAVGFLLVGGLENVTPGSFWDCFFFSVQTMGTIGYGKMVPQSFAANLLVTLESVTALLYTALATGLLFAKFSRPRARILWSQVATIAIRDGLPTLLFRVANERANHVVEAQMRVALTRNEVTKEGERIRKVHDLQLVRSQTPAFILTWLAMHPIDEKSPLYGATPEKLQEWQAEILVNLLGMDEVLTQTIHSRHSYGPEDIRFDHRFLDVLGFDAEGQRTLDYGKFHQTEPVAKTG